MNSILKVSLIYLASSICQMCTTWCKTQGSQYLSNDFSIIWTRHYKEQRKLTNNLRESNSIKSRQVVLIFWCVYIVFTQCQTHFVKCIDCSKTVCKQKILAFPPTCCVGVTFGQITFWRKPTFLRGKKLKLNVSY